MANLLNMAAIPAPLQNRPLRAEETAIITTMLSESVEKALPLPVSAHDLRDGGMGGVRFVGPAPTATFGRTIAAREYLDADGALVTIALNVDTEGNLLELDFWKVDFNSLVAYPRPEQLRSAPK